MIKLHVCFVCSGNVCRSPFAEGLLRHETVRRGWSDSVTVTSAGTFGIVDRTAHPWMLEEARRRGFDLDPHRSRAVKASHLRECDYILGFSREHVAELRELLPDLQERVYLLGAFPLHDADGPEIADPIRRGEADFVECVDAIRVALDRLLQELGKRLQGG
ncbi:MAG: low molecular weight protein-tyrosine-phosphatase [Planctomycetota bacterium]